MRAFFRDIFNWVYYKLTHAQEEKWRILAVALTLSAMFWFLRKMTKTYSTNMKVKMEIVYDMEQYVPLTPLPSSLWVNVTAQGWPLAIAAYSPNRPKIIVKPALHEGYFEVDNAIVTEKLRARFNQLTVNYLAQTPERYPFDSIVTRSVTIVSGLEQDTAIQWVGKVNVRGPSAIVPFRHFIIAGDISFEQFKKNPKNYAQSRVKKQVLFETLNDSLPTAYRIQALENEVLLTLKR
jgi:hypothetical protein